MSKKALLVLAFAALLGSQPSFARAFADVPIEHWAYKAVDDLCNAGIVEGYPDGTFRGPCAMTRYEFAIAIYRAYNWLQKNFKPDIDADKFKAALLNLLKNDGDVQQAVKDIIGPIRGGEDCKFSADWQNRIKAAEDAIKSLQRLVDEFRPELNALKADVDKIKSDLDDVKKRLEAAEAAIKALDGRVSDLEGAMKEVQAKNKEQDGRLDGAEKRLDAAEKTIKEHTGQIADLISKVGKLEGVVADHDKRIVALEANDKKQDSRLTALEKFQWFGSVKSEVGMDGSMDRVPGARDGDLGFEMGEAFSYLSLRAGANVKLNDDMRGRFTWWYDSDGNQHHGQVLRRGNGVMQQIGLDEAWVSMPGLGGRWIFGRQYAGQDYATGEAKPSLGMGTGYYTGAALTGIRGEYDLGKHATLTLLGQAEDAATNALGLGGNLAGVARLDASIPWWRTSEGEPLFKIGFQTVGHAPNNNAATVALGTVKAFNDGNRSGEWSISGDLYINILKGVRIEYTNQLKAANSADPLAPANDATSDAQSVYAEIGVLSTPTFTLNVKGGVIQEDFQASESIFTNPYTQAASTAFALFDRPVILSPGVQNFGPTQGFDVDFTWKIGKHPLKVRWAGSSYRRDLFNWMVYGEFPIVMTSNGNVSISGGYIDVDPGHVLGANTTAVRVSGGFGF